MRLLIVAAYVVVSSPTAPPARSAMDTITFTVTVNDPAARAAFDRGMVALHSFAYADAHDEFRAAIAAEPNFAMALWGEAMAFNRPVWNEQDTEGGERPFPYPIVRAFETLFIEPAIYLPTVLRDHARAGGRVVTRAFATPADVAALKERVVVNCTGLGSAALFGDAEMFPIKGQLTILRPQPEVGYITLPPDLYMFPRTDGIVLGGTFERGVGSLDVNREAEDRVLAGHAKFFAALGAPDLIGGVPNAPPPVPQPSK